MDEKLKEEIEEHVETITMALRRIGVSIMFVGWVIFACTIINAAIALK